MKIARFATLRHYARHILPVWDALPESVRCDDPKEADYTIVASWADADRLPSRALVMLEHGAGQTYGGDRSSMRRGFAGATGLGHVALFVTPNRQVAEAWKATYRKAKVAVVGCPALDRWLLDPVEPTPGLVAVTFHWDADLVCSEASSAWFHYRAAMSEFVDSVRAGGGDVVGHEHPKWEGRLLDEWAALGVRTVSYDEVMSEASLLAADNTSMLPEFAATGRPVVFLNSPKYRRRVWHGGRFWDWPNGQVVVNQPGGLGPAVAYALSDPLDVRAAREAMVAKVYAYRDGGSARRAADAILALPESPRVRRRRDGQLMGDPDKRK